MSAVLDHHDHASVSGNPCLAKLSSHEGMNLISLLLVYAACSASPVRFFDPAARDASMLTQLASYSASKAAPGNWIRV